MPYLCLWVAAIHILEDYYAPGYKVLLFVLFGTLVGHGTHNEIVVYELS